MSFAGTIALLCSLQGRQLKFRSIEESRASGNNGGLRRESIDIEQFALGELQSNGYLIHEDGSGVIVDPGGDPGVLIDFCTKHSITPHIVLATHGHFDHVGGVAPVVAKWGIPFAVSSLDGVHYENAAIQAGLFGCTEVTQPPEPDIDLNGRSSLTVGTWEIELIATPGHSQGSITFCFGNHLFVGDVLFRRGIGRADLPGGDMSTLLNTIRTLLFLIDDGIVYPGHGPMTTILEEREGNPFLV